MPQSDIDKSFVQEVSPLHVVGQPHKAFSQETILPLLTHTAAAAWHILA